MMNDHLHPSVGSLLQRAETLLALRDLDAAISAFHQAEIGGSPADRCAGGRWLARMLGGDFAEAWLESDAIRSRGAPDPHRFWTGEDLHGARVILRCLHGLGDTVQFLRFVPRLRAITSQLIVEVPPPLMEIASCFEGVEQVITWGKEAPSVAPAWDLQIEVMELPYIFRTQPMDLPIAAGYLHLPAAVEGRAQQHIILSGLPRVGIVWAAGEWDASRSLPLSLLQPLLSTPDCEFWNLQGGRVRAEWNELALQSNLRDWPVCAEDVLSLASSIAQLDLVITVDTLAAHVAGALRKQAWVLLQHAADWRWMVARSDSLWYPSLRLFRQPAPGDWASAIDAVQHQLACWLAVTRETRFCFE